MTDWKINQTHDVILVILAAVYFFPGDIQTAKRFPWLHKDSYSWIWQQFLRKNRHIILKNDYHLPPLNRYLQLRCSQEYISLFWSYQLLSVFQSVELLYSLTQWCGLHHTVKIRLKYFMAGVEDGMLKTTL